MGIEEEEEEVHGMRKSIKRMRDDSNTKERNQACAFMSVCERGVLMPG